MFLDLKNTALVYRRVQSLLYNLIYSIICALKECYPSSKADVVDEGKYIPWAKVDQREQSLLVAATRWEWRE